MVVVPKELLNWVDELMQSGQFQSCEHLLQRALWRGITDLMNERIDADLRGIATHLEYQDEARKILAEFEDVDKKC